MPLASYVLGSLHCVNALTCGEARTIFVFFEIKIEPSEFLLRLQDKKVVMKVNIFDYSIRKDIFFSPGF